VTRQNKKSETPIKNVRVGPISLFSATIHCIGFNCSDELYSVLVSTVRTNVQA
jgi:hypothetical protein